VADGGQKRLRHDMEKLVKPVMVPVMRWLVACTWWLVCWTAPALASWEAYQQAGEAAYNRGRYAEAERMFLAAVREARHFGPQDPRLDISLNKLELLRVTRSQQARLHSQHPTRKTVRQRQMARHGRQRHQPRLARQRTRPGRHSQARRSRRSKEYSRGARRSISRPAYQTKRPRAALHRAQPTRRAAPAVHHERRQQSLRQKSSQRAPHLSRGQQRQRPHSTVQRARPHHPERRARHGNKRRAARSPRRAMLHVGQPRLTQLWLQQRAIT